MRAQQLGDKIVRGKINDSGFLIDKKQPIRDYRVVGLNPNLKLLEILWIDGDQEEGNIEEFDWSITKTLRLMFPDNHFVNSLFSEDDWSHIWVGDF